jgi:hypothetical protein
MAARIIVRRADWDFMAKPSDDPPSLEGSGARKAETSVHRTQMQRGQAGNVPERENFWRAK